MTQKQIYETMFDEFPNMLSPEQVADIMNVSKETVYRMVRRGDYDSLKLGRIIRIPKACVLNYIVANLA
ncbi:MAG: helix-turn-helix domain-containing protein [Clostridia bacterium]|nr:helix-turn-helix domain-containing protein [Clostridia bacterium]